MSAATQRGKQPELTLVVDNLRAGETLDNRHAISGNTIPDGWFEEEVGYAGAEPPAIRSLSNRNENAPADHD
ncbi:hypothetical protein P3T18_006562 [Paraburkholderia sp. GAS199]|uniref:hypothetical protein n=1 Tax=Paraburkholderia sp. GAS199 TaxID=3035126 RepID=UPI003D262587